MQWLKWILLTLCLMVCSGCGTKELEQRGFPMAIGIQKEEQKVLLSFDFSEVSKDQGSASSQEQDLLSVEANTYYEAQKAYENNTNKVLDYNHLKAIILGESFLEDTDALRTLLSFWEQEEVVARNTHLFLAEEPARILSLTEKTNGSVGKYLEQMMDSQEDFKQEKIMTLGKVMNQWHNQNEVLLLPVLTERGGIPAVTEYAVVDGFVYKGKISVEDAMKVFLSQGQLRKFLYHLENGALVEVENIKRHIKILQEKDQIFVAISIKGDMREKGKEGGPATQPQQLRKIAEHQLKTSLEHTMEKLQKEMGFDGSNSFILLGGQSRGLYQKYQKDYDNYKKHIRYQYQVELPMLNE